MAAYIVASLITLFLVLVLISVFTKIKVPLIDYPIANLILKHQISIKRRKNNIVYCDWKLLHFDMETQDFQWENRDNDALVAKLRIKYNISKKTYIAFHNRWGTDKDVLEEITVTGDPKYLLKLFGIPRRVYDVIDASKNPQYARIVGYGMTHIITMTTNLRSE